MKRLLLKLLLGASQLAAAAVLDDMKDATPWKATASDQVKATVRRDARDDSLCLDYDFSGVSGYAVLRRELPLDWPTDFALTAQLKGNSKNSNDLQIKLVDASGDNVWWVNRPAFALPDTLTELSFKRRHVAFAWGPTQDRALKRSQFIEFVVVAGQQVGGGAGALCVGALSLEPREPAPKTWPEPKRTRGAGEVTLDFQHLREFNGLWFASGAATRVEVSDDNRRWKLLSSRPGRALFLGEQEWRWLRVRHEGKKPPDVELRDAAQWPDRNAAVAEVARSLPRGDLPRAFLGEQNYWTVVGVDGGAQRSGLVSEDGAVELTRGGPSVEPAVRLANGNLVTWAQVRSEHSLIEHALPVVQWRHAEVELRVETAADGPAKDPKLLARYTLRNPTAKPQRYSLLLTLRPWQVNPPQQFLSTPGGISPLPTLAWGNGQLTTTDLNIKPRETPTEVRAAPWSAGPGLASLLQAPPLTQLTGHEQLPSALMRFDVDLAPGEARTLGWVTGGDATALDTRLAVAAAQWRDRLGALELHLPAQAQPIVDTMRAALAQILMARDGPALRPGTRSYARAWIRDGAMMVAGLVRMGEIQAAQEFVDWFGGFIFESGKVPCCVDQRGADPVVENDSHGQYLFAVAELWRHSNQGQQDRALLERHWPKVQKVVAWMEALRQSERKPGADARFKGLMPPSISHEGYSDKPAYSYWDDFWALRGYKDAVQIAQALGDTTNAVQWTVSRDQFEADLAASIAATAAHYKLDHIAGAADRGDFDATSTTMALNPAQAENKLPPDLLRGTFERYVAEADARITGAKAWKDYTPYELRNVSALVRLGRVDDAHRLLAWFFAHQRPAGWHQWAEVVLPDARKVQFLGDMPHAWVSSDYLRAALDLLAYERESSGSLVLGAGLSPAWRHAGNIGVTGLSTAWGRLDYRLLKRDKRDGGGWTLHIDRRPDRLPGELRLAWPGTGPLPRANVETRALSWQGRELPLPAGATTVQLEPTP